MWKHIIIISVLVFSLGWISHSMVNSFTTPVQAEEIETIPTITEATEPEPQEPEQEVKIEIPEKFGSEQPSPHDWVSMDDIHVESSRFWVSAPAGYQLEWNMLANTNSMDPTMDETANAVQIIPKSRSDIHIGDVISYETDFGIIIHRVVAIGNDSQGWYAVTQGDNISFPDPEKVRFPQIRRIVIAIIY